MQVLVALPNGEQQLMPTEWTDLVNPPQCLPGARFLFERLVILRQRLDDLLGKEGKQAILTVREPEVDRKGGSDVDPGSPNPLGSNEPRAAGQDHGNPGRDAVTPMESGKRGPT
jgi:hypothetical protein